MVATTGGDLPALTCTLRYSDGAHEYQIRIGDEPFTIGRSPRCSLQLADESVSRRHARISASSTGKMHWEIEDLDSKNGVKVNTYTVTREPLHHGDRIDLGSVRLYVDIERAALTTRAKVVFEDEAERGQRTQVIDIAHLDSLLAASSESRDLDPMAALPHDMVVIDQPARKRKPTDLLRLFTEAAESLISSESLDETLDQILALVFNNLPAERGVICLYDETTDETEPKVMRTCEGVPDEPIRISQHIARDVIERRQSLLVHNTAMDERFGGAASVIMMDIHSAMCAPLYQDGHVSGFIYVDRQSGDDPFDSNHLQTLSALALLSAVAVEKTALRDDIRREREMRSRLARYSSPAVVDRIVSQTNAPEAGMIGHEGDVTVLFADLTGFTSMSERLEPAEIVRMLNRVFERLTEVIFDLGGTLDKFRGDGLMAFFGAPIAMTDHAERTVEAALLMHERLAELNAFAPTRRPLAMRIGINSGTVVVGDIGSPQRKDYTVIGDVVNTASRLESAVAQPGQVVVGLETYRRVRSGFACRALEPVQLKGKRQPVQSYLIVDRAGR